MATSPSEISPEEAAAIFAAVIFQLSGVSRAPWMIQIQKLMESISGLDSRFQQISNQLSQLESRLRSLESQHRRIWSMIMHLQKQISSGASVAEIAIEPRISSWVLSSRLKGIHPRDASRISSSIWSGSGRYLLMRKFAKH